MSDTVRAKGDGKASENVNSNFLRERNANENLQAGKEKRAPPTTVREDSSLRTFSSTHSPEPLSLALGTTNNAFFGGKETQGGPPTIPEQQPGAETSLPDATKQEMEGTAVHQAHASCKHKERDAQEAELRVQQLEEAIRVFTEEKAVLEENCNAFRSAAKQKDESAAAAQLKEMKQLKEQFESAMAEVMAERDALRKEQQVKNERMLSGNEEARRLREESVTAEDIPRNNDDVDASNLRILEACIPSLANDLSACRRKLSKKEEIYRSAVRKQKEQLTAVWMEVARRKEALEALEAEKHLNEMRNPPSTTTGEPSQKRARTEETTTGSMRSASARRPAWKY